MTLKSAIDNVFRSKATIDLQTVSAKLADAQAALSATEAEYQAGVLQAALSDDADALTEPEAKLAQARRRVESLETAFAEASRVENQRLSRAKLDARRSELAAIRQHSAQAARDAQKITDNLSAAIGAYGDLLKDVGKVEKLMTAQEIKAAWGNRHLGRVCQELVSAELSRLAYEAETNTRLQFPHAPTPMIGNPRLAPMLVDQVKGRFGVADFLAQTPPASPVPEVRGLHPADVTDAEEVPFDATREAPLEAEMLAKLALAHEQARRDGAEVSSAILQRNWHDTQVKHDGR